MRAKCLWPCLVICALATASRASGQSGVHWQPDLETARRIAAQTNRLILVHFWTESCGPCMRMEREVFSRPDVAAAIEANYIPVKVNVQRLPQMARQFGVNAWPTDVILTPQGGMIERRTGGLDAVQYVGAMNQIAARARGPANPAIAQATPASPYGSAAMAGQAMAPVNPAYNPSYPAQGGMAPQQPAGPPGPAAYNLGGGQQPNPGMPQGPGAASPTPTQAQPWQAETAQWNPGGAGPGANSGQVSPSLQTQMPRPEATPGQPSPASSTLPAADSNPSNPPLGLDGYCPVVLSEKERWVKGDSRYGVIHRGRTYLFAGPDEAKRFFVNPDRYAPVLAGIDVVVAVEENRQVPGKRDYGAWYEGRIYLFAGEVTYRKFDLEPGRYAAAAMQAATATARRPAGRQDAPYSGRNPGYPPPSLPPLAY
jgi:thiol-disulfide isomerase/thioredoxin/YHS domain-containing protein